MKSILILANHDLGLYKFRKELIIELLKEYKVYISLPNGNYVPSLIGLGCNFIETELDRRGINLFNDLKLLNFYDKIVNSIKPDIILSYTIKPNIYGGIIAKKHKIPYLVNITGLGTSIEKKNILQPIILNMYKFATSKASKIFFQNQRNYEILSNYGIAKENYILLPGSGVNLNYYTLLDYPIEDKIKFVFISRITKGKGINEYLEAAKYIKKKYSNVEFHICGFVEDDYKENLQSYQENGIIKFHGMVDDTREILKNMHCTIHPSYHEGMSNVLLESAASGRPVLASDIPGCREIFDEGINGFGFEPRNSESLIDTIEKFLNLNGQDRVSMGKAGRKKVEKEFNREIVINTYLEEIKSSLEE